MILKIPLQQLAEVYIEQLRDELDRQGFTATGDTKDKMRYEVTEPNLITIYAGGGMKFIIDGRRPGGLPPSHAIRRWVRARGLPERAVWPIMKKIADIGTDVYLGRRPPFALPQPAFKAVLLDQKLL